MWVELLSCWAGPTLLVHAIRRPSASVLGGSVSRSCPSDVRSRLTSGRRWPSAVEVPGWEPAAPSKSSTPSSVLVLDAVAGRWLSTHVLGPVVPGDANQLVQRHGDVDVDVVSRQQRRRDTSSVAENATQFDMTSSARQGVQSTSSKTGQACLLPLILLLILKTQAF